MVGGFRGTRGGETSGSDEGEIMAFIKQPLSHLFFARVGYTNKLLLLPFRNFHRAVRMAIVAATLCPLLILWSSRAA